MLVNLRLCLIGTIGSDSVLETEDNLVRVAYVTYADDRFTWARQLVIHCPRCSREIGLSVLSSNAMFFLMRLLLTAMLSVEEVRQDGDKVIFRVRADPTENQRTQLDMAMDVYRARRELTSDWIDQLITDFRATPGEAQSIGVKFYMTSVCWLIFHEIGHRITDKVGPDAFIGRSLDQSTIQLKPDRRSCWVDELSADITASRVLGAGIAQKEHSVLGPTSKEVGRTIGFAAGVVALTAFEIYEGYDIGQDSLLNTPNIGKDPAFATHPPIQLRKNFLSGLARSTGNPVNELCQVTECALHALFADYVDRHTMPQ